MFNSRYHKIKSFCIVIKSKTKDKIGGKFLVLKDNFKVEIGTIFKDDKRNLLITEQFRKNKITYKNGKTYKNNQHWYKYTCLKCGWKEGEIYENNLINGIGCAYEINVIDKDTDKILGTYHSVRILHESSLKDFGIIFYEEMLRQAAKYNKIYKGYKIKYTKDLNKEVS